MRKNRKQRLRKAKFRRRIIFGLASLTIISLIGIAVGINNHFYNEFGASKEDVEEKDIVIPESVLKSKDKYIQTLVKESRKNEDAKIILSNLNEYPDRLVQLAAEKPETIKFVSDYPKHKGEEADSIDISEDYKKGEMPHFLQWDERWGYEKYGDQFIAVNGCGPTSIAMVAVYLTGDTSINPKVVADYAYENGYLVKDVGSSWSLMTKGAKHFGISGVEIPKSKSVLRKELLSGHPVIAIMSKGNFTTSGHYLVLSGITEDGKVEVKDSDSIIRTNKVWDLDTILKETENLWVYKKLN